MKKSVMIFAACMVLASCAKQDKSFFDGMVDLGTHRLQFRSEGNGTPVVVIDAGLTDQLDKLKPLQASIARVTRVITYNRAGYGRSEAGPLPRDAGREAEEPQTVRQIHKSQVHTRGRVFALLVSRRA